MIDFISTSKMYISMVESTMLTSSHSPNKAYIQSSHISKFSLFISALQVSTQPLVCIAFCPCVEPSNDATSYYHRNMRTFNNFTFLAVLSCIAMMAEAAYPLARRDAPAPV